MCLFSTFDDIQLIFNSFGLPWPLPAALWTLAGLQESELQLTETMECLYTGYNHCAGALISSGFQPIATAVGKSSGEFPVQIN
jgi:hypothetical protein